MENILQFFWFYFEFSILYLFKSVCKDWSTSFHQISLLEGAQKMFLLFFPHQSVSRDAGHYVNSSVLEVEMNCPPHLIKSFPLLTSIVPLERYLKYVYWQSTCW